ncbi:hypothetical protein L7F22_061104 [Adiantum nelumboides]|nr:hypothetical protein [Adiantum nelumboides]
MADAAAQAAAAEEHDISASTSRGPASSPAAASQTLSRRLYRGPPLFVSRQQSSVFGGRGVLRRRRAAVYCVWWFGKGRRDGAPLQSAVSALQMCPVKGWDRRARKAKEGFTPLSLRDVKLEKSTVAWSDIGGLHETRRVLRETLEWPTKYAAIFATVHSVCAPACCCTDTQGVERRCWRVPWQRTCGLNFISVKGPEILNKYIGASEKSGDASGQACVLFFDEFDSIAPKRGHDSTGVTDRVVNQLLTQMDGAEGLDGVYVLAATSRPDLIDSALLRPGRLDKSLLCDMPSEQDRIDIMRAVSSKVHLDESVSLDKWASRPTASRAQTCRRSSTMRTSRRSTRASRRQDRCPTPAATERQ